MVVFVTGCGKHPLEVRDAELSPLVTNFEKEAAGHASSPDYENLTVRFSSNEADFKRDTYIADATCIRTSGLSAREILVNKAHWDQMSAPRRELLVTHELGHCALGLEHNSEKDAAGNPVSIMYPEIFGAKYFLEHKEELLTRLFQHPANPTQAVPGA